MGKEIYLADHPYTAFPDNPDEAYKQVIIRAALEEAYQALPPREAAMHIDGLWDRFLDELPDFAHDEGSEFEGIPGGAIAGPEARSKEVDL